MGILVFVVVTLVYLELALVVKMKNIKNIGIGILMALSSLRCPKNEMNTLKKIKENIYLYSH